MSDREQNGPYVVTFAALWPGGKPGTAVCSGGRAAGGFEGGGGVGVDSAAQTCKSTKPTTLRHCTERQSKATLSLLYTH